MLWRRRRCYDAVEETTLDAVEEKMLRCCGGDDLWRRQYYDVLRSKSRSLEKVRSNDTI